ncbi:MAG: deoxynucleoside kinase [Anaerolineae bacterium]|nr:deoxynucleoside kinase [Anaerolineae bacterium]
MDTTQKQFIAIAGNIGAGKSTLTGLLARHFGWEPFYEADVENPYLADFYTDMKLWSFHSQVFYLGKRLEAHRLLVDHPGSVVQDRTVYEDAEIFAQNLYEQGAMSDRDYDAYRRLYRAVSSFLPPPNVIIYLQGSVDTLMTHIHRRGRDYERNIAPAYLESLNRLYDRWIDGWTLCPVLRISMDGRDFAGRADDFAHIVAEVRAYLSPINLDTP